MPYCKIVMSENLCDGYIFTDQGLIRFKSGPDILILLGTVQLILVFYEVAFIHSNQVAQLISETAIVSETAVLHVINYSFMYVCMYVRCNVPKYDNYLLHSS